MTPHKVIASAMVVLLGLASVASAQTAPNAPSAPGERGSIAVESDILSFFISGYSGIINFSLRNKLQVAFGVGAYDVPGFLLESDDNFDAAQWTARVTSVQVVRATYRFRGPMKSGPALGAVLFNDRWRLESAPLNGETQFRHLGFGVTGGYYIHLGPHFYVYPTAAYTYNRVYSGETAVSGTDYTVEKFAPNASLHLGWEWAR